jgi:outer membrane immunogenic protein
MTKFLIGALLAAAATSAVAADLPAPSSAPAPVYAQPQFSWTGVYFGVNAGLGWAGTNNGSFGGLSGGEFGGTVGANYQMGPLVFGVEGDWDWASISHTQGQFLVSNHLNINEILTARARLGFALDRALIFVTGGYGGVDTNATFSTVLGGWGGSQNQWVSGGAIGAGVEYAFTNNITAKAEYLYLPLSSTTYFSSTFWSTRAPVDVSLLRAGLNYKF